MQIFYHVDVYQGEGKIKNITGGKVEIRCGISSSDNDYRDYFHNMTGEHWIC